MSTENTYTGQNSNAITKFNFYGDVLDIVRTEDGDVAVPLRQLCDALGIAFSSQLRKLNNVPWAVVIKKRTTGSNGKTYEMVCLHRRSIPLWGATIHPKKVCPELREKLVRYQKECAEVLGNHFLGKRGVGTINTAAQSAPKVPDAIGKEGAKEIAKLFAEFTKAYSSYVQSERRSMRRELEKDVRSHIDYPSKVKENTWANLDQGRADQVMKYLSSRVAEAIREKAVRVERDQRYREAVRNPSKGSNSCSILFAGTALEELFLTKLN
jgi:hypothetical protein